MMKFLLYRMLRVILFRRGEPHLEKLKVPIQLEMISPSSKSSFKKMKYVTMINGGPISFSGIPAAFVIPQRIIGTKIYNFLEVNTLSKILRLYPYQFTSLLLQPQTVQNKLTNQSLINSFLSWETSVVFSKQHI